MTELKQILLDLLYEENVQCDSGVESLANSIENVLQKYFFDDYLK